MKKTVLILLSLCCLVFAKETPRIAVYVSGSEDAAVNEALSDLVLDALVSGGLYRSIDRPQDFIAKTIRAHDSVPVDDSFIIESGKTLGAQYLCFVRILAVLGSNQISARIVGVEKDTVIELGIARSHLKTVDDLHNVSIQITERLSAGQNTETAEKTAIKHAAVKTETIQKQAEEESQKKSKEESLFIDPRDNREYGIKRIGGHYWFMQDLGLNGKEKYRWNEARGACPEDWRLPGNREWDALRKGSSSVDLEEFTKQSLGNWWSSTENGRSFAWFWYFSRSRLRRSVGTDHLGKANAYGVRCVRECAASIN